MNEAYMRKALANHTLTKLYDTGEAAWPRHVGFRLKRPGTGMYSFEVHFTGYGIFIQGDLSPVHVGGFGCKEYKSLGWFSKDLHSSYLASKFLKKGFVPAAAAEWIEDCLEESEDWGVPEEQIPVLRDLVDDLRADSSFSAEQLYDALIDLGRYCFVDDGVPGWTYDPAEVGWLMAIHECFQRCYQAASEVSNE